MIWKWVLLISCLRSERARDYKGHILGCFGSFCFLMGGCIDIAWRIEGEKRGIGDSSRCVARRETVVTTPGGEETEGFCYCEVDQRVRLRSGAMRPRSHHVYYENARSIVGL